MTQFKYTTTRNVIYSLITGFIAASAIVCLIYRQNPFSSFAASAVSLIVLAVSTLVCSGGFFLWFRATKKIHRSAVIICGCVYAVFITILAVNASFYFTLIIIFIAGWLIFAFREVFAENKSKHITRKTLYIYVGLTAFFVCLCVSAGTLARHWSFSSSTFDLGLFFQMYESMATDFTQNTTLERNELLSHFAVHFSPIYYLLLPVYMIFRNPECLLIMQVLIIFSGVFPLMGLCRKWRYSDKTTLLICLVFLFFPAFHCASFYDFHENVFLVPCILWLGYFLEKDRLVGIIMMSATILCIKEDAGIYLICIGLYALFSKKYPKCSSLCLLGIGLFGFIGTTAFLEIYGEGIKTSRYSIYLSSSEEGLTNVIMNVIKNPALFLSELLSEEKIIFVLQMLLPLGFIPFFTRKFNDWFLFLPFILVNLASAYSYQADINFQYIFGSATILIFLFAKNAKYVPKKNKLLTLAVISSILICFTVSVGKYKFYFELTDVFEEENAATEELIDSLDHNASIIATTYITPHLYDFPEVYMYPCDISVDYYVLDNRSDHFAEYIETTEHLPLMGYEEYATAGFITVFKKTS